jgi:lantibiotic modifying enzyme
VSTTSPVALGLQPILRRNRRWLARACAGLDVEVASGARAGAIAGLARALESIAIAVIEPELRAALALARSDAPPQIASDPTSWAERWQRFPLAAAHVDRIVDQWRGHIGELLTRLHWDHQGLRDRLTPTAERLPALIELRADVGDRHDHGRSVALLGFADGSGVVYKPKDLRVAAIVLDLFAALSDAGLEPALARRWMWICPGYAWEQRLAAQPCTTHPELQRFYQRIGGYLRVFQLLGASDMWMDNLIAVGEQPMFIDLETALGPERARDSDQADAHRLLDESVTGMALLGLPVAASPELPPEDLGALARPGWFRTPYRVDARLRELALGEATPTRDGFLLWHHDQHAPTLAGAPVDAWRFVDEIVAGYRETHRFACEHVELFTAAIDRLGDVPLRFIHRHTWFYGRILRKLLTPAMLRDPAAPELLFATMRAEAGRAEAEVIEVEIAALRRLDVPYLTVRASGRDLHDGTDRDAEPITRNEFERSPTDRARARLATIESFPIDRHAELVAALATLGAPRHERCETEAIRRGDELLALAGWGTR